MGRDTLGHTSLLFPLRPVMTYVTSVIQSRFSRLISSVRVWHTWTHLLFFPLRSGMTYVTSRIHSGFPGSSAQWRHDTLGHTSLFFPLTTGVFRVTSGLDYVPGSLAQWRSCYIWTHFFVLSSRGVMAQVIWFHSRLSWLISSVITTHLDTLLCFFMRSAMTQVTFGLTHIFSWLMVSGLVYDTLGHISLFFFLDQGRFMALLVSLTFLAQ